MLRAQLLQMQWFRSFYWKNLRNVSLNNKPDVPGGQKNLQIMVCRLLQEKLHLLTVFTEHVSQYLHFYSVQKEQDSPSEQELQHK